MVAHDQDVVALTLVGDGTAAALASGRAHRRSPAQRAGAAVLAVRRSRDTGHLPHRGAPDTATAAAVPSRCTTLTVGATVTTHGPRNAFPLTVPGYGSPARRFRFIAGGIGITPILPMLGLAQRLGVDWSMVYVGRSRDSLPFVDEVARFGKRIDASAPTTSVVCRQQRSCSATAPTAPRCTRAGPRRC